jgi:peptidyl-prolyl cis-trans isomerase C
MGDAFMFGQQHGQMTKYEASRLFGEDFADQLFTLPVGDWQGPVVSGYGLHLVRIVNKIEAERPELAEVRDRVRNEWLAERRRKMDEAFYQSLRQRYEIVIDDVSVKETASVD